MTDGETLGRIAAEIAEDVRAATWGGAEWADVCRAFTRRFPGSYCAIYNQNVESDDCAFFVSDGLSQEHITSFATHYAPLNPWEEFWTKARNGTIIVSERDDPAARYRHTEFYNDWMKRTGDFDTAVGMRLYGNQRELLYMPVHYGRGLSEAYDRAIEQVMMRLRPVFFEAIEVKKQVRAVGEQQNARTALIDRNADIAFVIDETLVLHDANARAIEAFRRGAPVRCHGHRVSLSDSAGHQQLRAACAAMLKAEAGVKSRFLIRSAGGSMVTSLARLPTVAVGGLLAALPQFVVQIADPRRPPERPDGSMLIPLFGLTPAEAMLCCLLADGLQFPEACKSAGVNYETGRARLKSIFLKTGTHSQAELRVLLTRL